MKIEIISGSPRKESATKRVALHLFQVLATQADVELGLIDLQRYHLPPVASVITSLELAPAGLKSLAERLFAADAFILVSPEYNGGYSPAMKNLLDHFPKQNGKAFGIATASPGAMGGMRAALALQHLVYGLFGIGSPHMLIVPEVDKKFSNGGQLLDGKFSVQVNHFINEFLWLARKVTPAEVVV